MATPPQHIADRLADDWHAVSIHEAGHAVVAATVNLPLHELRLSWQDHGHDWSVVGRTEVAANDGTVEGTADQEILFMMGGLEAEAMHRSRSGWGSLAACRRTVADIDVNRRGDLPQLHDALRDSEATFTQDTAQEEVHELLSRRWPAVEAIAEALRQGHRIPASVVHRHL